MILKSMRFRSHKLTPVDPTPIVSTYLWQQATAWTSLLGAIACVVTWWFWTPDVGSALMRFAWPVLAMGFLGVSLGVIRQHLSVWSAWKTVAMIVALLELWIVFASTFAGRYTPGLPPVTYFVPVVFVAAFLVFSSRLAMGLAIGYASTVVLVYGLAVMLRGTSNALEVQNAILFLLASLLSIVLLFAYARVREAYVTMQRLANTDALTGLANRRAIEEAVLGLPSCGVILVDLDHFKRVNDEHGHAVGDEVLQGVAGRLESAVRGSDRVGRWGGEEFLVVLSEFDLDRVTRIAERLHAAIGSEPLRSGLRVTASLGVAVKLPGEVFGQALERADRALYRAKEAGRNRVCVADGAVVSSNAEGLKDQP
jgi:diguanylate cyclase